MGWKGRKEWREEGREGRRGEEGRGQGRKEEGIVQGYTALRISLSGSS
jgi:hypothetical protein